MGTLKTITAEYFGTTTRKEELVVLSPAKREKITIIDDDKLLSSNHTNLLHDGASMFFKLGNFSSIFEVLKSMGVKVRICKGIPLFIYYLDEKFIDEAIEYWRMRLGDSNRLMEIIEELEKERTWMKVGTIRGRYLRKEKIIELYPEEMLSEPNGRKYFSYLLLSTFVHEAMHAYFDRPKHSLHPYAYLVEEPMAEFGMLLYLDEAVHDPALQKWAYNDTSSRTNCYRYGAWLFDQYYSWNHGLRNYLEEYKYAIEEFAMLDVDKVRKIIALPCPIANGIRVEMDHRKIIQSKTSADTMRAAIDEAIDAVAGKYSISNILVMSNHWSCPKTKGMGTVPLVSNNRKIYRASASKELAHSDAVGNPLFVYTGLSNNGKMKILNNIFDELGLKWKAYII